VLFLLIGRLKEVLVRGEIAGGIPPYGLGYPLLFDIALLYYLLCVLGICLDPLAIDKHIYQVLAVVKVLGL
jgi:hypothetical protein